MNNEEINSAEKAAEEILQGAYAEARAEECPQGEECAVHFRVDEDYFNEAAQYARLISYSGDYVVITDDNRIGMNPLALLEYFLGGPTKVAIPNQYETLIIHVGEGALGDLPDATEAIRYSATHDSWEGVASEHYGTVSMLEVGFIDVSKPKN